MKETDGSEIKKIELDRKHAEIVPGEAGSGVERGSAASAAQVCCFLFADASSTAWRLRAHHRACLCCTMPAQVL